MLGLPSVSSIAFSNAKVQKIICALRKINVKTHKKDTFGQFAPLEHIYNKVYVEVHVRYMIGTCFKTYTLSQSLIYKGFHEGIGICWAVSWT